MSGQVSGRAVILDRDGTMVVDRQYLSDPDGLMFLPGAAEGLRSIYEQGYRLIVITNQSGVGRGMFSIQTVRQMNVRLMEMVRQAGARLEGVYYCPHRPEEHCSCRKPGTQLMRDAASELGFEPRRAIVIGDKISDVEFGRQSGATTMLIAPDPASAQARSAHPDYAVRDLREAATILLGLSEH
ncbi:MAG TPA: HAD family hydrolase [Steroidobacteraceae bacterium]|nr:HAD family hydrolase [Steroidobacteraceae bacterium]